MQTSGDFLTSAPCLRYSFPSFGLLVRPSELAAATACIFSKVTAAALAPLAPFTNPHPVPLVFHAFLFPAPSSFTRFSFLLELFSLSNLNTPLVMLWHVLFVSTLVALCACAHLQIRSPHGGHRKATERTSLLTRERGNLTTAAAVAMD